MSQRVAWTDPLTTRERVSVKWFWYRYDIRQFFTEGIWRAIAHRLPRRIAYFTYIRVVAHAWAQAGNKHPDELTYQETCEHWTGDSA